VKLLIAMAAVGIRATVAAPSAACRRLAALMEQEEQAEQQRRAAELQAEREKAAEARRAAEKQGIDPKTEEINRYIAGKFAAWLEVHGEVAGYDAALGPTVSLAKDFSSYCFTHREYYSPLGNVGMGDAFGSKQLPYLLAKFSFPRLQLVGWLDLDDEALDTKAAPYKIALRSHWKQMVTSHKLSEHEKLAEEQQRSLVKVKWDDRAMSLAQDQCMRDVLRLNRSATRLVVMAFVRATCSRSGAFTRDWADLRELCLQWVGRNILNVYDFTWEEQGMHIEMPDSSVLLDAIVFTPKKGAPKRSKVLGAS
jgi:hypothetical protein